MRYRHVALLVVTATTAAGLMTGCSRSDVAVDRDAGKASANRATSPVKASPVAVAAGAGTGDLFIHGTISRNGAPAPGVRTWVEISLDDDSDYGPGETIPSWESPMFTTDAGGHYEVHIDPDDVPAKFMSEPDDDGRYANFQWMVWDGDTLGMWFSTLSVPAHTNVWRSDDATPADPVMDMSVDLGTTKLTVVDSTGETSGGEIQMSTFKPNGS